MSEVEVAPGEIIAEAGRSATRMFQVAEGYVRLVGLHEDGSEALITIFVAGNCFAETAVVSRRPYNHTSIAMVKSRVRVLHENDFWDLYHSHSAIPEALCRKFAAIISRQFTAREMRATTRLRVQIANMFADFAEKCAGDLTSSPIALDFPFTQSDIASIFDVTRQSVQREVTYFKEQQLVEKRDGAWTVLDLDRLRRMT
ncbi:MAG TPA: Crp/Fnr family transcriptional regulator [Sphingopyxis sp.]|uniref:Crp/Fnr family transcriptional regulator n=1 Tax=Sphingopyxis sp. TaxID=1908224 RepID=UPI002C8703D6|nr:Crp/Fnr family transcriptional regulator [Sphingopyxis sp.]HWW57533.1 Crp/Fnr family transcriptional regulator [Sphingopyxis sp.]